MLIDQITQLIGTLPVGYEPLYAVMAFPLLLWILSSVFSIIWRVLSWIGGD